MITALKRPMNPLQLRPTHRPSVERLQKPRKRTEKAKSMTIAAGFRCRDGVVLCADTQMTIPGILKYPASKIRLYNRMECQPAFAFCGLEDFSNMAILRLAQTALKAEVGKQDVHEQLSAECIKIHNEYFPLYPDNPLEMDMLCTIRIKRDSPVRLFYIRGPILSPVMGYKCIGAGQPLATSIASRLYASNMSVKEVAFLCVSILQDTKKSVDGCGDKSQIICLIDKGGWSTLSNFDRVSHLDWREEDHSLFQNSLREPFLGFTNYEVTQVDFENSLQRFTRTISERRKKRLNEYAKREEDYAMSTMLEWEEEKMATDDEEEES